MTEAVKPSSTKIATKWALIGLVITIVLTYSFDFLGIDPNSPAKYINYIPFVALLLLAQKELKDAQGGFITFGQGFSTGFRYSIFSGILGALFTFLYLKFSPGAWTKMLEAMENEMVTKGSSEAEMKMAMDVMDKGGILMIVFAIAVGSAITGAVVSLVGAAIFKKDRSPYDHDDTVVTEEPAS